MAINNITVSAHAQEYLHFLMVTPNAEVTEFPMGLENVIEKMAEANHWAWHQAKVRDGYIYGHKVDDVAKTHNLLLPFDLLDESVKEENRRNARESVALLLGAGCSISADPSAIPATEEQLKEKVLQIMEALHESWARAKANKGYIYGETRNDDPSKGPLMHRDMLPFWLLMKLHPEDAAYDRNTAKGAIEAVKAAGYTISIA